MFTVSPPVELYCLYNFISVFVVVNSEHKQSEIGVTLLFV